MYDVVYLVLLGDLENTIVYEDYELARAAFIDRMEDYLSQLQEAVAENEAEKEYYSQYEEQLRWVESEEETMQVLIDLGVAEEFLHVGILTAPINYGKR